MQRHVPRLEPQVAAAGQERAEQPPDQHLLRDDPAGPPAGQGARVQQVRLALVPELEVGLDRRVREHLPGQPGPFEDLPAVVVEHSGALPLLHIGAVPRLQNDAVDSVALQEVGEGETGRPGPDDNDIGGHAAYRIENDQPR